MTAIYKRIEEGRVGLRLRRKPTLPSSHNSLIVISNEVRNLRLTCIEKILPDNSVFETENDGAKTKKNRIIGLLVPEVYSKLQAI
jgi:hypothetical protein